jgi:hypothetical protein
VWGFEDTANPDVQTQLRQGLDPLFIHRLIRPGDRLQLLAIYHCGHRVVRGLKGILQPAPQQSKNKMQGKTKMQMMIPTPNFTLLLSGHMNLICGWGMVGGLLNLTGTLIV